MRILILGGDGMLGHRLLQELGSEHDVRVTLRCALACYKGFGLFNAENSYDKTDVRNIDRLIDIVADFRPQAVINSIGIVKQRGEAGEYIPSIEINALFPHKLAELCNAAGGRLIHISTDCVFSGRKGNYTEDDVPDAEDLYGRTKLLGEIHDDRAVTLRTSIIGLELSRKTGLIEWFLAQTGTIKGFRKAIYSGLTTTELARVINRILMRHVDLTGLWNVASEPISKYELLCMLAEKLDRHDLIIEPDDNFVCDRSLDAKRFCEVAGYISPAWDEMLDELAEQILRREDG